MTFVITLNFSVGSSPKATSVPSPFSKRSSFLFPVTATLPSVIKTIVEPSYPEPTSKSVPLIVRLTVWVRISGSFLLRPASLNFILPRKSIKPDFFSSFSYLSDIVKVEFSRMCIWISSSRSVASLPRPVFTISPDTRFIPTSKSRHSPFK